MWFLLKANHCIVAYMSVHLKLSPHICGKYEIKHLCLQDSFLFCGYGILPACMSMYHVQAWDLQTKQKEASDLLGLESQMVVSCHLNGGN